MVDIAATLIHWYAENKRELPWRETTDPYRIWISEIILQQTRVVQGLEYFNRFMLRFPDVRALAEAPGDEVMKYWQGLGYYSRARNLHAAAKEIVEKFGGEFPRNYSDVLTLKGIGEYTAAAICSFAWKLPYAVVDGNVYRVLARIFGIDTPIDSNAGTPKVPVCLYCPLRENCVALASGRVEKLPVKAGKAVVKPRYFNYLHIHCRGVNLLARREAKDIWQNLYEYPLIETGQETELEVLQQTPAYLELMQEAGEIQILRSFIMPKHVLSHRIIYARFYEIEVERFSPVMQRFLQVPEEELEQYAVSRLIALYREK